jgi:hypothetical protein
MEDSTRVKGKVELQTGGNSRYFNLVKVKKDNAIPVTGREDP